MPAPHEIDTSLRFDRRAKLPKVRDIEKPGIDPIPHGDPPMIQVAREPYLASEALEEAVNLAIALGRPLLLQGDPGAGKTQLAYAVAFALGLPLEEAYIKSTSRAQDLLYFYDAVRRLYDAQLVSDNEQHKGGLDVRNYIHMGPLGRAIARSTHGRRSIVLIDEVDKADIDFPNDLLREMDRLVFDVPEVPGLRFAVPDGRPDLRPIVFVTNNEEKPLPAAFLRRCIFHYVEFPDDRKMLDQILALHGIRNAAMRAEAIDVLVHLRQLDLSKKPGLSELLDWVGYLQIAAIPPTEFAELPYNGALLKQRTDQRRAIENLAKK
jgi:MoxR-like ATPase